MWTECVCVCVCVLIWQRASEVLPTPCQSCRQVSEHYLASLDPFKTAMPDSPKLPPRQNTQTSREAARKGGGKNHKHHSEHINSLTCAIRCPLTAGITLLKWDLVHQSWFSGDGRACYSSLPTFPSIYVSFDWMSHSPKQLTTYRGSKKHWKMDSVKIVISSRVTHTNTGWGLFPLLPLRQPP